MTQRTLSMDVRVGDSIRLDGGRVVVTVEAKSGQRARLSLHIEQDVAVERVQQPAAATAARAGITSPR